MAPLSVGETDLVTPLANGMKSEGTRLRNGQIVESTGEGMYFVSAELYGSGIGEPAPVGTWATESTGGAGAIWTVDEVAQVLRPP